MVDGRQGLECFSGLISSKESLRENIFSKRYWGDQGYRGICSINYEVFTETNGCPKFLKLFHIIPIFHKALWSAYIQVSFVGLWLYNDKSWILTLRVVFDPGSEFDSLKFYFAPEGVIFGVDLALEVFSSKIGIWPETVPCRGRIWLRDWYNF